MFELIKERMEITVNKRTEKHGDDSIAAYDARLSGDFQNAFLLKLDERLRTVFYGPAKQGDIEADYYPDLLFPLMGPIAWDLKKSRMTLHLHDVDSGENDLQLSGKDFDKLKFTLKSGGTVALSFRVVLGQLEEDELLKLLRVDNQRITVSLWQAALEETPDNFQQADLLSQEPHSEARAAAESLFNAPPPEAIGATSPEELLGLEPADAAPAKAGRKPKLAAV